MHHNKNRRYEINTNNSSVLNRNILVGNASGLNGLYDYKIEKVLLILKI